MKKHNFSAGPSILPQEVFLKAAEGVTNLNGTGLSVLEISHRSPDFTSILQETKNLVTELLKVPDNYHILFLTGGASSQFYQVALNLLDENSKACFIDTGTWSAKAIKESNILGKTEVIASSKDRNYAYIPRSYQIPSDATYLHITSNNTIFGTQYHAWPETDIPLVVDMSSDIFSKEIEIEKFGLIYAGAQKNLGPAGVTLVIIRDDLVGRTNKVLPTMLNYQTHVDKNSLFNTPPVFPIYVSMLNLRWLKNQGGVATAYKRNMDKSSLLYEEIDNNGLFKGVADQADRSYMNPTFTITKPEIESVFLKACEDAGCVGVKGHRSVGGFRASMYNAMTLDSVQALVDVMQDFSNKFG
jgi:phosphoserine aminotransferase